MKILLPRLLAVAALAAAASSGTSAEGGPGQVDLSFNPGSGVDEVGVAAVQADGSIIVGGGLTTVRGLPRNGIARLHPDGSGDESFKATLGPFTNGLAPWDACLHVSCIAIQPDTKVLVAGAFTTSNGARGIVRLNSDGSIDPSFNPGSGVDFEIVSIALQQDGKVVIGGLFTSVNGNGRNGIARLNADGSVDLEFDPGSGTYDGTSANPPGVYSIALQPDGKLFIGGAFYRVDGTSRRGIARLNAEGSLDTSFDPGTGLGEWQPVAPGSMKGFDPEIRAMALQPDGKVIIGGWFTLVNGTNRNGIARLDADGGLDTSFDPGLGLKRSDGIPGSVHSLVLQPGGKVLIGGGWFSSVNGLPCNGIARLNADGSLDSSFELGQQGSVAFCLGLQPDGKILVGGEFSSVNGFGREHMTRLNTDGTRDQSFNPGTGPYGVSLVAAQPNGAILIQHSLHLERRSADGSIDGTFSHSASTDSDVSSLVIQSDGKIVLAGEFTKVNGLTCEGIARLNHDGSLDDSFRLSLEASVSAVAMQPDGKLIVGGHYSVITTNQYGGGTVRDMSIARLHANGTLDDTFKPAIGNDSSVTAVAVEAGGNVFVALIPNTLTLNAPRIVRLHPDGSVDGSFTGAINDGPILHVALQSDGKAIVAGSFRTAGGAEWRRLARLNLDGSLDQSFDPGSGPDREVQSIALLPDGRIVIGGWFTSVNGISRKGVAVLNPDGSLDTGFDPDLGSNCLVYSVAVQLDGKVLVGGTFTSVNGVAGWGVARLYGYRAPLTIARSGPDVIISWPSTWSGFSIQESSDLALPWLDVTTPFVNDGLRHAITLPATLEHKYFRAIKR